LRRARFKGAGLKAIATKRAKGILIAAACKAHETRRARKVS
jgi:hypothetical protein